MDNAFFFFFAQCNSQKLLKSADFSLEEIRLYKGKFHVHL